MTREEYRLLHQMVRRYQLEDCKVGGKTYNACDRILTKLFPYYYDQLKEQER